MNGCAPGLASIERFKATRKWAISFLIFDKPLARSNDVSDPIAWSSIQWHDVHSSIEWFPIQWHVVF